MKCYVLSLITTLQKRLMVEDKPCLIKKEIKDYQEIYEAVKTLLDKEEGVEDDLGDITHDELKRACDYLSGSLPSIPVDHRVDLPYPGYIFNAIHTTDTWFNYFDQNSKAKKTLYGDEIFNLVAMIHNDIVFKEEGINYSFTPDKDYMYVVDGRQIQADKFWRWLGIEHDQAIQVLAAKVLAEAIRAPKSVNGGAPLNLETALMDPDTSWFCTGNTTDDNTEISFMEIIERRDDRDWFNMTGDTCEVFIKVMEIKELIASMHLCPNREYCIQSMYNSLHGALGRAEDVRAIQLCLDLLSLWEYNSYDFIDLENRKEAKWNAFWHLKDIWLGDGAKYDNWKRRQQAKFTRFLKRHRSEDVVEHVVENMGERDKKRRCLDHEPYSINSIIDDLKSNSDINDLKSNSDINDLMATDLQDIISQATKVMTDLLRAHKGRKVSPLELLRNYINKDPFTLAKLRIGLVPAVQRRFVEFDVEYDVEKSKCDEEKSESTRENIFGSGPDVLDIKETPIRYALFNQLQYLPMESEFAEQVISLMDVVLDCKSGGLRRQLRDLLTAMLPKEVLQYLALDVITDMNGIQTAILEDQVLLEDHPSKPMLMDVSMEALEVQASMDVSMEALEESSAMSLDVDDQNEYLQFQTKADLTVGANRDSFPFILCTKTLRNPTGDAAYRSCLSHVLRCAYFRGYRRIKGRGFVYRLHERVPGAMVPCMKIEEFVTLAIASLAQGSAPGVDEKIVKHLDNKAFDLFPLFKHTSRNFILYQDGYLDIKTPVFYGAESNTPNEPILQFHVGEAPPIDSYTYCLFWRDCKYEHIVYQSLKHIPKFLVFHFPSDRKIKVTEENAKGLGLEKQLGKHEAKQLLDEDDEKSDLLGAVPYDPEWIIAPHCPFSTQELLMACTGRLHFAIQEDNWELAMFLDGAPGSGKSMYIRMTVKYFYKFDDRHALDNARESYTFAWESLSKHDGIIFCEDAPSSFIDNIGVANFKKLVTGNQMQTNQKQQSRNAKFNNTSPMVVVCNSKTSDAADGGIGDVSRRKQYSTFKFTKPLDCCDPNAWDYLGPECATYELECLKWYYRVRRYLSVKKIGLMSMPLPPILKIQDNEDVWERMPGGKMILNGNDTFEFTFNQSYYTTSETLDTIFSYHAKFTEHMQPKDIKRQCWNNIFERPELKSKGYKLAMNQPKCMKCMNWHHSRKTVGGKKTRCCENYHNSDKSGQYRAIIDGLCIFKRDKLGHVGILHEDCRSKAKYLISEKRFADEIALKGSKIVDMGVNFYM